MAVNSSFCWTLNEFSLLSFMGILLFMFFFVLLCLFLLFLQPNCNNYNVNPLEQFWPSQLHPVKKKKLVLATHIVILRVWHRYRDGFQQRRTFIVKEDHPFVTRTRALLKGDMLLWNLAGGKLRQEEAGGKINQIRGDKFGVFRGESASNNLFPRLRLNIQLISKIQLRQQP